MKRLGHIIEYGALRIAAFLFMCLPLWLFYRMVRGLGYIAFDILRLRRTVTMDNLRAALGDRYDEGELTCIARAAYGNIAVTFAEIAIYPRLKPHIRDVIDASGISIFENARKTGSGIIMVTCHYGSWELLGGILTVRGIPVTAVGKTQSNALVDQYLGERRAFIGIRTVARGAQVKHIVQAIRDREVVLLVSDQDAGRRGIFAPMFGMPASTPAGAAQLALRYKVPVVVAACERTGNGTYQLIAENLPVRVDDNAEILTARMNEAIESIISRHPEQYLWMHKRWKTRPPGNTVTAPPVVMAETTADRRSES